MSCNFGVPQYQSDLHVQGLAWLVFIFSSYLMCSSESMCLFPRSHIQHILWRICLKLSSNQRETCFLVSRVLSLMHTRVKKLMTLFMSWIRQTCGWLVGERFASCFIIPTITILDSPCLWTKFSSSYNDSSTNLLIMSLHMIANG